MNKDILISYGIDLIEEADRQNESEKEISVKHFYIDLRHLVLKQHLEKVLDNETPAGKDYFIHREESGFSIFDLSVLLKRINIIYG